jgi:hypothetical protein
MYWNFVAIDGVIKNQLDAQQDATPKGKNIEIAVGWKFKLVHFYKFYGNGKP